MKALKSMSVQILLLGTIASIVMSLLFMWAQNKYQVDAPMSVITVIATGFTGLVVGRKVRESFQANNGHYYDEKEEKLKKAE